MRYSDIQIGLWPGDEKETAMAEKKPFGGKQAAPFGKKDDEKKTEKKAPAKKVAAKKK